MAWQRALPAVADLVTLLAIRGRLVPLRRPLCVPFRSLAFIEAFPRGGAGPRAALKAASRPGRRNG